MTTLYLIRHAAAEGNLYRMAHGQFNSTITAQGYRQLAYLRKRFEGVTLDAVYGSDLLRTHTTASALYVPRGLEFQPMPRMREICMGIWEQLPWGEIARQNPTMHYNFNHAPHLFALEGAESFAQVQERMLAAVRDIAAAHPHGTVAATSHGAALRVLLGTLQGMSLSEIGDTPYGNNTAVSLLEIEGDDIRVVYRDDDSHIPAALKVYRRSASPVAQGERQPTGTQAGLWFQVAHEDDITLVLDAMQDEETVGCVALREERDRLHMTDYEIFPAYRGRHYSVQLLGQAVKYARLRGRESVGVTCPCEDIPYFAQYGFTVVAQQGNVAELRFDLRRIIRDIPALPD